MPLIDVALPLPLFRTFTYEVADGPRARAARGLARRRAVPQQEARSASSSAHAEPREGVKYKDVVAAPDDAPVIDAPMLALCRWIAEYYVVPLGVAIRCALPAALTAHDAPGRRARRGASRRSRTSCRRCSSATASSRARRSSARCSSCIESLGGRAAVEHLHEQLEFSPSVLKRARGARAGRDRRESWRAIRSLTRERRAPASHAPSPRAAHAIDALARREPARRLLLHGVTGSGKTLVYIELLRRVVLERGTDRRSCSSPRSRSRRRRSIASAPCSATRSPCCTARSATASGTTRGSRSGAATKRIAVGARSAIFAPLANLGAIVVDEEHESSYKQGETPRYHAREVAIVRARAEGAVVVLGSATPSLESWANATAGKYDAAHASRARRWRRGCRTVDVIDLREGDAEARRASTRTPTRPFALRDQRGARARAAAAARKARSRASCCSTGAAIRRSCSAATAATSPRARTAASASRITARRSGWSATTASTPRRCASTCPRAAAAAAAARARHAAGRAAARRAIPDGAHRAHGCRHDERQVGARRDPRSRRRAARSTSCSARR